MDTNNFLSFSSKYYTQNFTELFFIISKKKDTMFTFRKNVPLHQGFRYLATSFCSWKKALKFVNMSCFYFVCVLIAMKNDITNFIII